MPNKVCSANMRTETTIVVTQQHTDELGHLNHVAAVRILEQARDEWYQVCGLYSDAAAPYGTVVVNINYDYRHECFVGQALRVVTQPQRIGTKSIVLSHQILKPGGEIAISGTATSVVMEMQKRTIVAVPDCVAIHFRKQK